MTRLVSYAHGAAGPGDAAELHTSDGLVCELTPSGPLHPGVLGLALHQARLLGRELKGTLKRCPALLSSVPLALFDTRIAEELLSGGVAQDARREGEQSLARDAQELGRQLEDSGLDGAMRLEMAVLPAVAEMELAGVPLNLAAWQELVAERSREVAEIAAALSRGLGIPNPASDDDIREALSSVLGEELRRTGRDVLVPNSNIVGVSWVLRLRQQNAFLQDLGRAVMTSVRSSHDGRVHCVLDQIGCVTGRFTASSPNLLAVPRDHRVRACFEAPPGSRLIVADYSALELRVLAEVAGDEQLQSVFVGGGDPHRATAALLLGKGAAGVTKAERQLAKPVNFGCAFGMTPLGIIDLAQKNYGIGLTLDQARGFQDNFFLNFPRVRQWQQWMQREAPPELRTLGGRRRIFVGVSDRLTARLATVVQGSAADGVKMAIAMLRPRLGDLGAKLLLVIHDELLVEAREENATEVMQAVVDTMQRGMATYVKSVPIVVKAKVCRNWAEAL